MTKYVRIIIIIFIFIIIITFMQDIYIYKYIPRTIHVFRVYNVSAVLYLPRTISAKYSFVNRTIKSCNYLQAYWRLFPVN